MSVVQWWVNRPVIYYETAYTHYTLPLGCRFLTGNPCTKYEGYREYVVVAVPQLRSLDGMDITRTERLQASQVNCGAQHMLHGPLVWLVHGHY